MRKASPWIQVGRYIAVTLLALIVVLVFRRWLRVNQTTVALTFLVLILVAATRWRLAISVYLSILFTGLYNFFFLPPVGKLTITDPQNWLTLFAFLATSVLVSHLSASEHRQAEQSRARREEIERLYEFSQQMLMQQDPHDVARAVPSLIAHVFHVQGVGLYLKEGDSAYYSDPENALVPLVDLKQMAQSADANPRQMEGVRILPLTLGMRSAGALAITYGQYSDEMYDAIGSMVAIALERASALERFARVEAAREGERLRTALLDSITHELRTPLTAIRAAATSLVSQHALSPGERQEMFAIVDEESVRLDRLIGQAVEMAQLDSTSIQVERKPRHIRDVIDLAIDDLRTLLRDHPVTVNIGESLPAIPMDRELVRRVLRHLLENSAKYSAKGSAIEIESHLDNYRLLVLVTDHGPGIDPADLQFIFDKFYRGSRQRERVQGTGMGLAIAKAILHAHGGGIEVVSRPGTGTTFTAWLPAADS